MASAAFYIDVDTSDLQGRIKQLQACMKPERFEERMHRIYNRTGARVKTILREDLPQDYNVAPGKISNAVKSVQVIGNGCIIPIRDKRGNIGSQYPASGGAHGWNSLHRSYRVKARILKSGQSTLPAQVMAGYPPFRNLGSKLGKLTFTRTSKERGPIKKVSGIAIPQMPMNRSKTEVQKDIHDWMALQVEKEFMALMRGY